MANNILAENSIEIIRGSSKTLLLYITDASGLVVDITGSTIYFTVKQQVEDIPPLIQKISTHITQIEITSPKEGQAKIYLTPSDTSNLMAKTYKFDIWVVLVSGKRYAVVPPSDFVVKAGVTVIV